MCTTLCTATMTRSLSHLLSHSMHSNFPHMHTAPAFKKCMYICIEMNVQINTNKTFWGCKNASRVLAGALSSMWSWSLTHFMSVVGVGHGEYSEKGCLSV